MNIHSPKLKCPACKQEMSLIFIEERKSLNYQYIYEKKESKYKKIDSVGEAHEKGRINYICSNCGAPLYFFPDRIDLMDKV